jgi:hypothetical protein
MQLAGRASARARVTANAAMAALPITNCAMKARRLHELIDALLGIWTD